MSRLFVFCSLTFLLCLVAHHCAAHSTHAQGAYLSVNVLDDQGGKDSIDQQGAPHDASSVQPRVDNADANKGAEEAIANAQEKVKAAESALSGILQSAQAAQTAALAAEEKEVKETEAAKAEADKLESSAADASKFVTVITQAVEKAKLKVQEAKQKAESAVTKANGANSKLRSAKDELKEAEATTESSQKKQKASDAGTNADSAATEAKNAQTDKAQSTTALSEVKGNHRNTQIALYTLKAVVGTNKVTEVCDSIEEHQKSIEAVKAEVDAVVQTVEKTVDQLADPLKQNGRKQHDISKTAQQSVQNEVKKMKRALSTATTKTYAARRAVGEVKTKTFIDAAKAEYDKVEMALASATAEEQNALTALNNAKTEVGMAKRVQQIVDAILNADNVYIALNNAEGYEAEAKQDEQSAIANIGEIEAMKTDDMTDESKQRITEQLDAAKKILETLKIDVQAVTKASHDTGLYKAEADKVVDEAEKAADAAAAEKAKNKANGIGVSALKEMSNAKKHFDKVRAEAESIEKLKYATNTVALAHDITKVAAVAKGYVEEAKAKEKAAEISFGEIEALLADNHADVRKKVAQQLNAANQAWKTLKDKVVKVISSSTNAEKQKDEANNAVTTALQASSLTDAKKEAQKTNNAVSTAEKELQKAQTALEEVKKDADQIERVKHAAKAVVSAKKVNPDIIMKTKSSGTSETTGISSNSEKSEISGSSSNKDSADETPQTVETTDKKPSDRAVNPYHTSFILVTILFCALMIFGTN